MLLRLTSSGYAREYAALLSLGLVLGAASMERLVAQEIASGEILKQEVSEAPVEGSGAIVEASEVPESESESLSPSEENKEPAPNEIDAEEAAIEPAWIQQGDYTDSEHSVDYRLIEAGGHSQLSECEIDFEREMIRVAKDYVEGLPGVPDVWEKLKLTPGQLRKRLVHDRDYVKEHENEFGTAYLKYGQLAFDEAFRNQVNQTYLAALQRDRVSHWGLGLGCLIGTLAVVSFILKRRG